MESGTSKLSALGNLAGGEMRSFYAHLLVLIRMPLGPEAACETLVSSKSPGALASRLLVLMDGPSALGSTKLVSWSVWR